MQRWLQDHEVLWLMGSIHYPFLLAKPPESPLAQVHRLTTKMLTREIFKHLASVSSTRLELCGVHLQPQVAER